MYGNERDDETIITSEVDIMADETPEDLAAARGDYLTEDEQAAAALDIDPMDLDIEEEEADDDAATTGDDEGTDTDDDAAGDGDDPGEGDDVDEGDDLDGEGEADAAADGADPEGEADDEGDEAIFGEDGEVREGFSGSIPYPAFKEKIDNKNNKIRELEAKLLAKEQADAKKVSDDAGVDTGSQADADSSAGKTPDGFDLKAKIIERNEAIADGDQEAAAEIDMEIETHRQSLADAAALRAVNQSKAQEKYHSTLTEVANRHLEDLGDPSTQSRYIKMINFLVSSDGKTPVEAALEAETMMFGAPKAEVNIAAEEDTSAADKADAAKAAAKAEQKKNAVKKNADAASRQPPGTAGVGQGNRDATTKGLTALEIGEKEYANLSEKEKAKRRGDIVE
jgi:hypothetical protein